MVNSRNKGKNGELEFCKEIYNELGVTMKRNLTQTQSGGHDLVVVVEDDCSKFLDRFAIEVKRSKKVTDSFLYSWWEQATRQAIEINKIPLLAYRKDAQSWRVVIPIYEIDLEYDGGLGTYDWTITMSLPCFGGLVRELS